MARVGNINIDKRIKKCEKLAKENNFNVDFLGVNSCINPINVYNKEDKEYVYIEGCSFWIGYILNNIKITYSYLIDKNFNLSNQGYYYYINNNDYLYEFKEYIKDKNINSDIDFIYYVYSFIRNYFYSLTNYIDRDNLHKLIIKNNNTYYNPIKEHSLSDFKNNNSAKCSEYSAILQNILSIYDYETIFLAGTLNKEGHAYNIAILDY